MSQASQLNIYFVLPEEDRDAECSRDMYEAFTCVKQYRGKPQWVLPSFCLSHISQDNDVFVFENFKGAAFEKLKKDSAKIVGPRCMLTCLSAGDTIPPGKSPVFTEGMRGLIICCTGFDSDTRKLLEEKIVFMGGIFHPTLRAISTHVVAYNNITAKAVEAYKAKKPIMTADWVDAVWERSLVANVRGNDSEFEKYRSPLFYNLKITTTGIPKRRKEAIKNLVNDHGGTFTVTLERNITDILIIELPEGEKYNAAKKWDIACVKPSWILESVEQNRILSLSDHGLQPTSSKSSTPKRDNVNFTGNFSMVSAIENDETRQGLRFEETVDVTASQMSQKSNYKNDVNSDIIDKILSEAPKGGQCLDGCNIFLSGFSQTQTEKLKRVLNVGGATRFDELTPSVTHIVVAAAAANEAMKDFGAHIVSLDWLAESVAFKKPAPVDSFLIVGPTVSRSTPPSPLSKQGALLLSRPEAQQPEDHFEEPVDEPLPINDLVNRYNLSQQGEPLLEKQRALNVSLNATSFASGRSEMSQTCSDMFQGLKFYLSKDLAQEELEGAEALIVNASGTVISRKFSGVPDYAVVPIVGASLTDVTALEVVNLLYIKDCAMKGQKVSLQYYHQPISLVRGSAPLAGCVISVSKYEGPERDFVETVIEALGATVQAILAKRSKNDILKTTHLICAEPSGMKFEGAMRWGLPVVHHNWLLKCAELGVRVFEEPYLISESKVISQNSVTDSIRKQNTASSSNAFVASEISVNVNAALIRSAGNEQNSTNAVLRTTLQSQSERNNVDRPFTPETPRIIPLEVSSSKTPQRESTFDSSPLPFANKVLEAVDSPINKALDRIKKMETPKNSLSPDMNRTKTPDTPYGAVFGNDNPSPGTRKRLYKWMQQGANFTPDPPAKRHETSHKVSTPVSELISRQLSMLMRRPEDRPPDDSPSTPKRLHFSTESDSIENDVLSGLQKMKEIEESYSRTNVVAPVSVSAQEEPKMLIVTESQPHTEIGWDDPTDRDVPLHCVEKTSDQVQERMPKIFMFSGLTDNMEPYKELIVRKGGKMSSLSYFDKSATHLIAASSMTRGEKLMGSIAAGLWILHPKYLDELCDVKDIYEIKEEDYEWGNPRLSMPLHELSPNVRECVLSAYHWRCDILSGKKPRPFSGMKIILKIAPPKGEVFKRLLEAGGCAITTIDTVKPNDQAFCICEMTTLLSKNEMESLARKGISCVATLFISDVILRKTTAVEDNLLPGFADILKKIQKN